MVRRTNARTDIWDFEIDLNSDVSTPVSKVRQNPDQAPLPLSQLSMEESAETILSRSFAKNEKRLLALRESTLALLLQFKIRFGYMPESWDQLLAGLGFAESTWLAAHTQQPGDMWMQVERVLNKEVVSIELKPSIGNSTTKLYFEVAATPSGGYMTRPLSDLQVEKLGPIESKLLARRYLRTPLEAKLTEPSRPTVGN